MIPSPECRLPYLSRSGISGVRCGKARFCETRPTLLCSLEDRTLRYSLLSQRRGRVSCISSPPSLPTACWPSVPSAFPSGQISPPARSYLQTFSSNYPRSEAQSPPIITSTAFAEGPFFMHYDPPLGPACPFDAFSYCNPSSFCFIRSYF